MNSSVKKLIYEDSDFEEPQTLPDFGPVISSAKDLANYLLNRGFVPCNYTKDEFNPLDICMSNSTKIKIEPKHTEYPGLKGYEIGIYKQDLDVYIEKLSNKETKIIQVLLYIHLPYGSRNNRSIYTCFDSQIPNTELQNFAYLMEEALTHFENAQKYIDEGKSLLNMVRDILYVFKPLMTKIK